MYGVGVDGKPLPLPTATVALTYVGDPVKDPSTGQLSFAPPPADWQPWDATTVAVGDLPVFSQVLGDGKAPFRGPAALLGLDLLSQRRIVLGAAASPQQQGRRRRFYVSRS